MKKRVTLTIFFLFASRVLFSAYEAGGQLLSPMYQSKRQSFPCVEIDSKNDSKRDGVQERVYDEQLTEELQQLFEQTGDPSWHRNRLRMIELIHRGANPNVSAYCNFLLHSACLEGDNNLVATCLTHGALTENINIGGETALYNCISVPSLELLLKFGANFNYKNRVGETALHSAVMQGRSTEVMEFLSCYVKPIYREKRGAPLHDFCGRSNYVTDFAKKMALLLWWLPSLGDMKNKKGEDYLLLENLALRPVFEEISRKMKRVHALAPQLQDEENKEMESMVKDFLPVVDVVKLVSSFSGPPYISLRHAMATEKAKREFPKIAQFFAPFK